MLYLVTSTYVTSSQFQFVCDITDKDENLIQRLKQQPNPSDKGVFNIGQVLLTQLEPDQTWKTALVTGSALAGKDFKVLFGEEYADTSFAVPELYDGITNAVTGSPAVSASLYSFNVDGLVEPNSGDWNFASSSYYVEFATPTTATQSYSHGLTSSPRTLDIQSDQYHTVGLFNGNLNGFTDGSNAHDVFMMRVRAYDGINGTGTLLDTLEVYNTTGEGGGPRAISGNPFGTYVTQQSGSTRLQYWGVGPQNLADYTGSFMPSGWQSYTVEWYPQEFSDDPDDSFVLDSFTFNLQEPECIGNGVRLAWKNELGVWDYYTFTLAESNTTGIERIEYRKVFTPFSSTGNTAEYSVSRRGKQHLVNKLDEQKTCNSDWLTQAEADWIQELFYSSNVYIQDGTDFVPIIVTDAQLTTKTNPRTQKNFQYLLNYKIANPKRQRQ